jgi:glycosyltransferase involved in cell wall biosynthesis
MKRNVLILTDTLARAGAESIAVQIAAGLKRSHRYDPVLCATRSGGVLEAALEESGVEYFVLGRRHAYDLYKFRPLVAAIREKNIHVVHAHKMGSNFWGSVFGKLGAVPAIVTHVHGQRHTAKERTVDRLMAALSDRIVVVSEYERALFLPGRERIAGKVTTVYNGIDCRGRETPDPRRVRQRLGVPAAGRLVGVVAALRPEKAIDVFLRAAAVVSARLDDVHCLIVGDGTEMSRLKAAASALGLDGRCSFTGFRDDAADIVSVLDCCVLSSQREGLPLTLLEYLAQSRPVVATRVGGIPEVIEDGVNGFLVPAGDHEALAEKIVSVLENGSMAAAMGEAGHRICRERFSLETMISNIETIYDEVLAAKTPRVAPR